MPSTPKTSRCWPGYEPTPGVPAFQKGSCRKIKNVTKVASHSDIVKELQKLINAKEHIKLRNFIKKNEKVLNSKSWETDSSVPNYLKTIGVFANQPDGKAKNIVNYIALAKGMFSKKEIRM